MKRLMMAVCVLLCLLLAAGCGKQKNPLENETETSVIQTADIDLQATNMSGYDWFLYEADADVVSLKNDTSVYLQADGINRQTDVYRFTMESVAPGTASVEFRYAKGEKNLENCIGKAIYTVTVEENRAIRASLEFFEDPKAFAFVENIGDVAMENLNLRCICLSLPDNEQDANSWYVTFFKEGMAYVAKDIFTPAPDAQWGKRDFYIEANKKGKTTISFYYIPDAAINGTMEVPMVQTVDENGETVEMPAADNAIAYACETAEHRAIYIMETDKELKKTIVSAEEYLPDVTVPLALSAKTVYERSGLDTSDPDLHYQAPIN